MQEGAFALIDCLGWKGIWNRKIDSTGRSVDPLEVLKKINRIEDRIGQSTKRMTIGLRDSFLEITFRPRSVFLSDTVAVSVPIIKHKSKELTQEIKRALSIEMACVTVAEIIDSFVEEEPFLTMRGCITYGEHLIRRSTFVGPAIDEAANNYELPVGAFVWVHPKASEKLDILEEWKVKCFEEIKEKATKELDSESYKKLMSFFEFTTSTPVILRDYEMPIKGGGHLNCHVLNPLCKIRESEDRAITIERYLSSFDSDKIDILLKKQNTAMLLARGSDKALEYYDSPFDYEFLEKLFSPMIPKGFEISDRLNR